MSDAARSAPRECWRRRRVPETPAELSPSSRDAGPPAPSSALQAAGRACPPGRQTGAASPRGCLGRAAAAPRKRGAWSRPAGLALGREVVAGAVPPAAGSWGLGAPPSSLGPSAPSAVPASARARPHLSTCKPGAVRPPGWARGGSGGRSAGRGRSWLRRLRGPAEGCSPLCSCSLFPDPLPLRPPLPPSPYPPCSAGPESLTAQGLASRSASQSGNLRDSKGLSSSWLCSPHFTEELEPWPRGPHLHQVGVSHRQQVMADAGRRRWPKKTCPDPGTGGKVPPSGNVQESNWEAHLFEIKT